MWRLSQITWMGPESKIGGSAKLISRTVGRKKNIGGEDLITGEGKSIFGISRQTTITQLMVLLHFLPIFQKLFSGPSFHHLLVIFPLGFRLESVSVSAFVRRST